MLILVQMPSVALFVDSYAAINALPYLFASAAPRRFQTAAPAAPDVITSNFGQLDPTSAESEGHSARNVHEMVKSTAITAKMTEYK